MMNVGVVKKKKKKVGLKESAKLGSTKKRLNKITDPVEINSTTAEEKDDEEIFIVFYLSGERK